MNWLTGGDQKKGLGERGTWGLGRKIVCFRNRKEDGAAGWREGAGERRETDSKMQPGTTLRKGSQLFLKAYGLYPWEVGSQQRIFNKGT